MFIRKSALNWNRRWCSWIWSLSCRFPCFAVADFDFIYISFRFDSLLHYKSPIRWGPSKMIAAGLSDGPHGCLSASKVLQAISGCVELRTAAINNWRESFSFDYFDSASGQAISFLPMFVGVEGVVVLLLFWVVSAKRAFFEWSIQFVASPSLSICA